MGKGPSDPAPSAQERKLAEVGARRWNRFAAELSPTIGRFVELSRPSESDRRDIVGEASGVVARELAGFRPRSGQGASVMQAFDAEAIQSAAPAAAAVEAENTLADREQRALSAASALGQGVADAGIEGLGAAGRRATEAAIAKTERQTEFRQGLVSAAASLAGAYGQSRGWFDPRTTTEPVTLDRWSEAAVNAGVS